jgi:hypothetical protein
LEAKKQQRLQAKAERREALEQEEKSLPGKSSSQLSLPVKNQETADDHDAIDNIDYVDRHPERRARVAYVAYEDRELPILRKQFPSLKLSQHKELLWKKWQKSPENPMNQRRSASAELEQDL